ncbi:MAG: PEP-CTERM sorting domain-containing protein [bacterium]|nr:PEP-CTERM sorting domain-containing protein [bacterium]
MQSLQVLLELVGLDLSGWNLSGATGVLANGTRIVGYGGSPDVGLGEGFVAVIPEPSTALLMGLGFAGLAGRRRTSPPWSGVPRGHRSSDSLVV